MSFITISPLLTLVRCSQNFVFCRKKEKKQQQDQRPMCVTCSQNLFFSVEKKKKSNKEIKDLCMLKKKKSNNKMKDLCEQVLEAVKETYLPLMKVESAW